MILKILKPYKFFNRAFYPHLNDYGHRTEVYYGGASSGKSHFVYQKVIIKAIKNWKVPRKILVLRKVGSSIKDSSFAHIKEILSDMKLLPYCHISNTTYTITLPNGAQFIFKGLDDPEKIKSIKGISDVVMEEATEFNEEDFLQLGLRLRDKAHKMKQMFLMFNPISKTNWVYRYFFEQKTSAYLLHSTYKDNAFLDEETKASIEMLRGTNPTYYRIYALGEFATLDKLVIPNFERRIISEEEVKAMPLFVGLDFGYVNDPSALVSVRYDKANKRIFITKEYVKKGMLNDEVAKAIIDLGLAKEEINADSAEVKSIVEIQRQGVPRIKPVDKWIGSVIQGVQWLLQHKITIDSRCFETIEEAENWTFIKDKKSGEYTNEPVDAFNHTWDAIRYALFRMIKGQGEVRLVKNVVL